MGIDRRQFCESVGGGTALLFLASCGGGSSGYGMSAPAPAPVPGCGAVTITGNHGHTLTIPMADLTSMVDKTYSIQGSADHNHTITLTPVQLGQIGGKMAVIVSSTTGMSAYFAVHAHDVTSNCS